MSTWSSTVSKSSIGLGRNFDGTATGARRSSGRLLKSTVADVEGHGLGRLEDLQQKFTHSSKGKGLDERRSYPCHTTEKQVTGNEEIANSGHRKARAQEAQHVL